MKRRSILAVIVLYKSSPVESVTVRTLARSLEEIMPTELRLKVVMTDNSPQPQRAPGMFTDEVYLSFPGNPGLAYAYNLGIQIGAEQGYEWILTLDQDTTLPAGFLREMLDCLRTVEADPAIGSVVPQIVSGGRVISPYWFRGGAVPTWFPAGYAGVPEEPTYAINSASLFSLSALQDSGGYDARFWLDGSDHAIFHSLAKCGKKVCVAPFRVEHRLSIVGPAGLISGERLWNMLAAESAFWDLRMSRTAGYVRNAKLLMQIVKLVSRGESRLAVICAKHLKTRLFRSRQYRLRSWEDGLERLGKN